MCEVWRRGGEVHYPIKSMDKFYKSLWLTGWRDLEKRNLEDNVNVLNWMDTNQREHKRLLNR